MKKLNISVLLLVFFTCDFTYATVGNNGIPTEEQVQKLAAAVWKEPIKSIDMTFYEDYTTVPEPVEQIHKRAEEIADEEFKQLGRPLDKLEPYEIERRNKNIEVNFKNWIEDQKFPRKIKKRVRISGDNQRIDFVKVGPDKELGPDTPFIHTFINTKDANTGDFVSYHYAGDMNTVFVSTRKWTKETIVQFAGIPITGALQVFLGIDKGTPTLPNYIPDQNKMTELARTGFAFIESIGGVKVEKSVVNKISVYPDPNAPDTKDKIEIGDPNSFPTAIMVCDRKDYSRVYHAEYHIPTTNQLIYFRECGNFNSNGFPHNITEIRYDANGNFMEKSVYKVLNVELNSSIPSEIFKIHPPQGYKIVDQRSKK